MNMTFTANIKAELTSTQAATVIQAILAGLPSEINVEELTFSLAPVVVSEPTS